MALFEHNDNISAKKRCDVEEIFVALFEHNDNISAKKRCDVEEIFVGGQSIMNLEQLGWNTSLEQDFKPFQEKGYIAGRIALEHKNSYRVYTAYGDLLAEISGKMNFQASSREDFPAVGDWVAVQARLSEEKGTIHGILPRKSKFSRKIAGETTEEQIIATNIDTVFLVNALNNDFNIRRIERYLIMAWESGANPVIILSKADLCENIEEKVKMVESVAFGVPIHVISAIEGTGLEEIHPHLRSGKTIALLGSSGVGKSTIINQLTGKELLKVQEIREGDDKGKHTTTHRELILLANGGCMIDTPGMRELQLWESSSGISDVFADIEELAEMCYYSDCQHQTEPKCAIRTALNNGELDQGRYQNYLKLQKELAYLERKGDQKAQLAEKEKWKKIHIDMRQKNKFESHKR